MQPSRRNLLTLGLSQLLGNGPREPFNVVEAKSAEDALRVLAAENADVLLLGPKVLPAEALEILARSAAKSAPPTTILLCADSDPDVWQRFVDSGQIFYLGRGEMNPEDIWALIESAAQFVNMKARLSSHPLAAGQGAADRLLDLCARLPMQMDLASAGRLLIETGGEVLHARIVHCFVYDLDAETLTPADASENEKWSYSAASGLAAFVARTAQRICLERVGADPRFDSDIDAPLEMSNGRFLAEPIFGPAGSPAGVLTAIRGGEQPGFTQEDCRLIELLAECASPTFNQILLQNRIQSLLSARAAGSEANSGIFRQEALDYHVRTFDQQGEVLAVPPLWVRTTFWIVVALFSASLIAAGLLFHGAARIFGKVN
jgi:hypothetical protein